MLGINGAKAKTPNTQARTAALSSAVPLLAGSFPERGGKITVPIKDISVVPGAVPDNYCATEIGTYTSETKYETLKQGGKIALIKRSPSFLTEKTQ